jgi:hypothetical protein
MNFEDSIKNINDKTYVDRRINQLKYLIFDSLNLPKDNVTINIQPSFSKSNHSERFTDLWNIDIFINIEFEVDPILSEIATYFNRIEVSLDKVFRNVGVNQFFEFVKKPDSSTYEAGIFVSNIELDGSIMKLNVNIDYETIAVEDADDL